MNKNNKNNKLILLPLIIMGFIMLGMSVKYFSHKYDDSIGNLNSFAEQVISDHNSGNMTYKPDYVSNFEFKGDKIIFETSNGSMTLSNINSDDIKSIKKRYDIVMENQLAKESHNFGIAFALMSFILLAPATYLYIDLSKKKKDDDNNTKDDHYIS